MYIYRENKKAKISLKQCEQFLKKLGNKNYAYINKKFIGIYQHTHIYIYIYI